MLSGPLTRVVCILIEESVLKILFAVLSVVLWLALDDPVLATIHILNKSGISLERNKYSERRNMPNFWSFPKEINPWPSYISVDVEFPHS